MHHTPHNLNYPLVLTIVGIMLSAPALAEKPAHAGGGQAQKSAQNNHGSSADRGNKGQGQGADQNVHERGVSMHEDKSNRGDDAQRGASGNALNSKRNDGMSHRGKHFDESRQASVRDYYAEQIRAGHCPPGLAKKNNGCLPPGQAKKWAVGQQLPRDVIFHNLPSEILGYLGPPPNNQRFVRVDNDILLISSLTGLVLDAMPSLGQ